MELIFFYILIGLIGGITAGMLGLGGGIIFVPGLLLVHKFYDLFSEYQLQAAVYTSLICIVFAGSASAYLHFKNDLIEFSFLKRYSLIVGVGCFFGIFLLEHLESSLLESIYSVILLILAFLLISNAKVVKNNINRLKVLGSFYFFVNGVISSLMGIGGGTLSVPYLTFILQDIKKSIATASAIGLVISVTSIIFMVLINTNILISKINYLSLIAIIPSSIIGSYIGVSLLKIIDPSRVKIIFASLLVLIALYLFSE